jgi:hypothetical protein
VTFEEFLAIVVGALEGEDVPYMLTGSVASSRYGEPRSTNDVDAVVDPTPAQLDGLVRRLQLAGLYVELDAARAALAERGQFNAAVLDLKADFIVRKGDAFSTSAFGRRRHVQGAALDAILVSPEDLILTKLAWAIESGSDRQRRDVQGMVAIAPDLDRAYLDTWAARLGIGGAWAEIVSEEADP